MLYISCYHTEVIVGFNPTSYSDEEGQAISFIVDILEGQAQANVLVNFATRDVTASGNLIISDYS